MSIKKQNKDPVSLETLVHKHASKRKTVHQQLTFVMLLVSIFTLTWFIAQDFSQNQMPLVQGYVIAQFSPETNSAAHFVGNAMGGLSAFRDDVRAHPDLVKIKLFFYVVWIIIVLVGSAVYYEINHEKEMRNERYHHRESSQKVSMSSKSSKKGSHL